jgi:hypothetical protein
MSSPPGEPGVRQAVRTLLAFSFSTSRPFDSAAVQPVVEQRRAECGHPERGAYQARRSEPEACPYHQPAQTGGDSPSIVTAETRRDSCTTASHLGHGIVVMFVSAHDVTNNKNARTPDDQRFALVRGRVVGVIEPVPAGWS